MWVNAAVPICICFQFVDAILSQFDSFEHGADRLLMVYGTLATAWMISWTEWCTLQVHALTQVFDPSPHCFICNKDVFSVSTNKSLLRLHKVTKLPGGHQGGSKANLRCNIIEIIHQMI